MKIWKLLIPFCAVIIVGCASTGDTDVDGAGAGVDGDGATTSGADGSGSGDASALSSDLIADLMNNTIVYFVIHL